MAAMKRRRRASGDLSQLKVELWAAIAYMSRLIEDEALTNELRLKACHSLAIAAGSYRALLQESDFESRLALVEKALKERNGHHVA